MSLVVPVISVVLVALGIVAPDRAVVEEVAVDFERLVRGFYGVEAYWDTRVELRDRVVEDGAGFGGKLVGVDGEEARWTADPDEVHVVSEAVGGLVKGLMDGR